MSDDAKVALATPFHKALVAPDWAALRALLTDDATLTLPGKAQISGTVLGADAVTERAKLIASFGLNFSLLHMLVSDDNVAPSLHNIARSGDHVLDEYLATVSFLRHRRGPKKAICAVPASILTAVITCWATALSIRTSAPATSITTQPRIAPGASRARSPPSASPVPSRRYRRGGFCLDQPNVKE